MIPKTNSCLLCLLFILILALHLLCFVSTQHQDKVDGIGILLSGVLHFDLKHHTFNVVSIVCNVSDFLSFVWFVAAIV